MAALAILLMSMAATTWAQDLKIVPAGVSLEGERTLRWVPGQLIVKYKTSTARMTADEVETMGLEHVRDASGGHYVYQIPADTIRTLSEADSRKRTQDAVAAVAARPDVAYAQPNFIVQIAVTPDDPGYPIQWHYFDNGTGTDQRPGGINLPQAWDRTVGDPSIVVAVIDTGILPNHPDITGSPNVATGFDMISNTFTANDGDGRDNDPTDPGDGTAAGECGPGSPPQGDSWHGTHVAGTVGVGNTDNGSGVAGVNWNTRVQSIRALGRCGGSTADINDAIRWAAGLAVPGVPNNPNPARVINMSLGAGAPCSASPSTQSAVNDAFNAGVLVVAAAGNEAQDAANSFPASCDNVLTVAASDFNGELVTRYSNFGADVEILAPGGDVAADVDNDGNPDGVLSMVQAGFAFFNGTSMASPHVAGVAGLLLAQDDSLTPQELTNLITSNAIARSSSQCPQACGAGLLNANIDVGQPPPPPPPPALVLQVSPANIEVDEGESATLTATLTQGGSGVSGETISFVSSNTGTATVSPATANTNSSGAATTTVTGGNEGDTQIVVSVQGQSQPTPVTVSISVVPMLGLFGLAALLAIILTASYRRMTSERG